MNWKLYDANFDEETGISTASIITDLGIFNGKSKLHEEDKDISSKFTGCKYAEMRAVIKYGKMIARIQKEKVNNLKLLINNLEKINNYNSKSAEARFIRKTYFMELEKLNKYNKNLKGLKEKLYNNIKNYRENYNKAIKKLHKEPKEEK